LFQGFTLKLTKTSLKLGFGIKYQTKTKASLIVIAEMPAYVMFCGLKPREKG